MTVKSSARVGYLNLILAQGGGNLNNSIFKTSNARGIARGGGGDVDVSNRSTHKANEQSNACRNILTYATPCRYVDFCTFIPFGSSLTALRSLLVLEKFTMCQLCS